MGINTWHCKQAASRGRAHPLAELGLVAGGQLLEVGVQVRGGDRAVVVVGVEGRLEQDVLLHRACTPHTRALTHVRSYALQVHPRAPTA